MQCILEDRFGPKCRNPQGETNLLARPNHANSRKSRTFCSLMMLILMLCCVSKISGNNLDETLRSTRNTQTINRMSYGVIFKYSRDVVMTSELWSHVFIIKLPQKVFADEQNFLETLHAGETPARALCMKSNGDNHFYSERQGLRACKRFENHVKYLIQTATKGYENLHSLVDDIY